jgi:hypothetical protein
MSTEKQGENTGRDGRGRFTKDTPTAFKPGQSGNPAGRPKSITLSEAIRLQLAQKLASLTDKQRGLVETKAIAPPALFAMRRRKSVCPLRSARAIKPLSNPDACK